MNAKSIVDQLMRNADGQRNGRESGNTVDRLLQGLKSQLGGSGKRGGGGMTSKLGSGALALLVGSKRGRRLGGGALKYGAIAGLGSLAWKAWQNHQGNQAGGAGNEAQEGQPIERLQGDAGERRSLEILEAMIMTARADGHIDATERDQLTEQMNALGADDELRAWIEQQLQAPLDAEALARGADSPQAAREMYVASLAVADDQNPMEKAWLKELSNALGIDAALATELERQVSQNP